jgi:hypothetical protein
MIQTETFQPPKRRRGRAFSLSLFLAAGGGLMQQCAPMPTAAPATYATVVVGDSITADAKDELATQKDIYVDGIWGRGIDSNAGGHTFPTLRTAVAAAAKKVKPQGWLVIQDDGGEGVTTPEFVKYVTDLLPDDRCLAWVSPSNDTTGAAWLADSQAAVTAGLLDQPCNAYIDWYTVSHEQGVLHDGLHANQDGQWLYNHLIWTTVR